MGSVSFQIWRAMLLASSDKKFPLWTAFWADPGIQAQPPVGVRLCFWINRRAVWRLQPAHLYYTGPHFMFQRVTAARECRCAATSHSLCSRTSDSQNFYMKSPLMLATKSSEGTKVTRETSGDWMWLAHASFNLWTKQINNLNQMYMCISTYLCIYIYVWHLSQYI